ncbi:MAG TPA: metal-dependent phosphohydrolase [Bauldia sp.]|nr:metal-dependent phosphohydrolase [Bauldia sp.]
MITVPELAAQALGNFLSEYMTGRFEFSDGRLVELVPSVARISLECIGNSDALYHNVEHTMLVTLAGHDIMRGRALQSHMTASDYAHIIIACLTHDIGYVRGIFAADGADGFVVGAEGRKVKLSRGASDAALMPYHVDRSELFILDRFKSFDFLDPERIARAVEGTRFPSDLPSDMEQIDEEAGLLRAADLIGQLGDPHYIRKANALYHEFEESGLNRQLGYDNPADLVDKYPQFYWNSVAPHVQTAIRYLNVTARGRQWIANLYSNVFRAERDIGLSGPQK